MKRRLTALVAVAVLAAAALAGCSSEPAEAHGPCVQWQQSTVLIPQRVGQVTTFTPIITNVCVQYAPLPTEES